MVFEVVYRTLTKRRLSEFIDWRLREKEEFLDNFEGYLQQVANIIRERLAGAEIYLLEELARGERKPARQLHVAVVTPEKLSPLEEKEHEKKVREQMGLKPHHPFRLSFYSKEEKEKLEAQSPRRVA